MIKGDSEQTAALDGIGQKSQQLVFAMVKRFDGFQIYIGVLTLPPPEYGAFT